jgi:hypothetical protein
MVTLHPSGRLLGFTRIPDQTLLTGENRLTTDWAALFAEAGLNERDFRRVEPDRAPLVPHDNLVAWSRASEGSPSMRVSAASLRGGAVYFDVSGLAAPVGVQRSVYSSRRPPVAETLFWMVLIVTFIAMAVIARRNLRAEEGDRTGARKLAIFTATVGLLGAALHAHHVQTAWKRRGGYSASAAGAFYGAASAGWRTSASNLTYGGYGHGR